MKKLKPIPQFKTEAEEAKFWNTHDSTEYIDWSKAKRVRFSNLKPTSKTITLRLPVMLLSKLRLIAHKKDVPYQSLMKVFLSEKVEEQLSHKAK